jgi:hypothetical protein
MQALPHILASSQSAGPVPDLTRYTVAKLRKIATFWGMPKTSKVPAAEMEAVVRRLWADRDAAGQVIGRLRPDELAVLTTLRRYGSRASGEVLRLDLLARGVLRIVERPTGYGGRFREWAGNSIPSLAERGALLGPAREDYYYGGYGYGGTADKAFPTYRIHPTLAPLVPPAGPPPWPVAAMQPGDVRPLPPVYSAETALHIARLAGFLATGRAVKINRGGELSAQSLRALEKAVPMAADADFPLPDAHGLFFEILRAAGIVRLEDGTAEVDTAAAGQLFRWPSAYQAHAWARGWLEAEAWLDGVGVVPPGDESVRKAVDVGRPALAWYLSALAHAEEQWVCLDDFLYHIHAATSSQLHSWYALYGLAWDPRLAAAQGKEKKDGEERMRAFWMAGVGAWLANALLITLPALGLVERGTAGGKKGRPWCFRLSAIGREVFGAPERLPAATPATACLVVLPNFDVIAYLDRADAAAGAGIGQLTEGGPAGTGPVHTLRLTRGSVYQALESGWNQEEIVAFLRRHAQDPLPANVEHSLAEWSARREALVLHTGATLFAFPTPEAAGKYLAQHPGTACGDRFVLATGRGAVKAPAGAVVVGHPGNLRQTWTLSEDGACQTAGPVDLVQAARLRRMAEWTSDGWRFTPASVGQGVAGGLKLGVLHRWVDDHLAQPAPPLLLEAMDAWAGRPHPATLSDALLLHIPDADAFEAVANSPRLGAYLLDIPGPGWLIVRRETRKEFLGLLEYLGFTVGRDLVPKLTPRPADGGDPSQPE